MTTDETAPTILVIDDDRSALESLSDVLRGEGYRVVTESRSLQAIRAISSPSLDVDLILTDLRMPEADGTQVLQAVREHHPHVPLIILTAFADMDSAIEAIRKGAYDYLSKPFKLDFLRMVVRRALDQSTLLRENRNLRTALKATAGPSEMIGRSPEMVEVYKLIAKVAPLGTTVLIEGESGTGKEMVASVLHRTSGRKGPFKAINCGALSETLLESELFGHVRGAFTGAVGNKKGIFEAAQGGTVFLDEVSNTSENLQVKLLRVLEAREVLPVGSTEAVSVDVRIVAASNRRLTELVEQGKFREDLLYRLKVVTIELPPLRDRRGDIPLLVEHFVQAFSRASSKAMAVDDSVYPLLARYPWPGNVRELENAVERAIALNRSGILVPEDFPAEVRQSRPSPPKEPTSTVDGPFKTLDQVELEYIRQVMEASGQNVTRAAEILGIDRRTIYRILERHGVERV